MRCFTTKLNRLSIPPYPNRMLFLYLVFPLNFSDLYLSDNPAIRHDQRLMENKPASFESSQFLSHADNLPNTRHNGITVHQVFIFSTASGSQ